MQRKAAKKPSTIASRGRGGITITARSQQAQGHHDDSDSDAPRDVLSEHQRRNGVPRAPDPSYLESRAGGGSGPSVTDTDTKTRNNNNGDPTTLKYYSPMWKAVLNRARFLSRLDIVTDNAFPERHVYLSSKPNEFIAQAIAEFQEDGMPHDELFLREHQRHMGDFVGFLWLLDLYSHLNSI